MGKADIGGKYVLGNAPETWVRWLFRDPELDVLTTLTEEFRFVLRHSDELLLVQEENGRFLLLTELQLHDDARMPRRMRAYTALAEERYDLPTYPVVLHLLPPGKAKGPVACYHETFKGLVARQDYRVVNAWEIEATEVLEREVLALIPYVPLMKGAGESEIRDSARLLRQRDMGEEMEVVLALFASFVMEPEQVQRIMRWNMSVLKESPWYQEILQEGEQLGWKLGRQEGWQEGKQEGKQEGRQEGQQEALQTGILRLFKVRFDPAPEMVGQLQQQLQKVTDLEDLEDLLVRIAQAQRVDAFLAELARLIEKEQDNSDL